MLFSILIPFDRFPFPFPSHVQSLSAVPLLFSSCCCVAVFAVPSTACFLVFSFFSPPSQLVSSISAHSTGCIMQTRLSLCTPPTTLYRFALCSNCAVSCFVIFSQFLCPSVNLTPKNVLPSVSLPSLAISNSLTSPHFSLWVLNPKDASVSIRKNLHFYFFRGLMNFLHWSFVEEECCPINF